MSWLDFEKAIVGREITGVKTYGKNLLVCLKGDNGYLMGWRVHFSSTGWFFPEGKNALPITEAFLHTTADSSNRVWYTMDNGDEWVYRDSRTWGKFWVGAEHELWAYMTSRYGPDWTKQPERAAAVLEATNSKRAAKEVLTDQGLAAGVGNYLACEALFLAKVHPRELWSRVSPEERKRVTAATLAVIQAALSSNDHSHWKVFTKLNEPCSVCQTPIAYVKDGKSAKRGSYFCPVCQIQKT